MSKLMTHLVADYPNPKVFNRALEGMLETQVDYLEIQLPFSHPVADGPTIHQANQVALQFGRSLTEIVQDVTEIKTKTSNTSTKLLLMSYLTPILHHGLDKTAQLLAENNFFGLIVPDLTFFSPEHNQMLDLCRQYNLQLLPVISPITTQARIEKIKPFLTPGQLVYATSRVGQTGKQTSLDDQQIQQRLDFLKANLSDFVVSIGFGISQKAQVQWLNKQGFVAVIGSAIVREIEKANSEAESAKLKIKEFLRKFD